MRRKEVKMIGVKRTMPIGHEDPRIELAHLSEEARMLKALIEDAVEVTFRRTYDPEPDVLGNPKGKMVQLYVRYAETDRTFSVLGCSVSDVLAKGSLKLRSAT